MTVHLHVDTDVGGDPDDACALGMLLGWPDVDLTGVTTTVDPGGLRAGYAAHLLAMGGRADVPVTAGAEVSLTHGRVVEPLPSLWPPGIASRPGPLSHAHDLLTRSIDRGATVVAIGPLTTLASLERQRPGTLARARVVVMGGWTDPLAADLPQWGPQADWNVAWDPDAAYLVATTAGDLTWVPLAVTLRAALRAVHLPRLRASGPLGRLLADQAVAYADQLGKAALGRAHDGLPDDLVLVLHDPLACAVALGWSGVAVRKHRLTPEHTDAGMVLHEDPGGRPMRMAEQVDGAAFSQAWLSAVEAAQSGS